jgi:hypothetical protein
MGEASEVSTVHGALSSRTTSGGTAPALVAQQIKDALTATPQPKRNCQQAEGIFRDDERMNLIEDLR